MIKRVSIFLLVSIFILCLGAISIYFINPFGVKTDNIRPRLFGIDIYQIPSKSMQPLLLPGDYITVSNTAYLNTPPKRNDVVVFYKPDTKAKKNRIPYIKRIIAIGEDSIEMINAKVYVNDTEILEKYVSQPHSKIPYSTTMKKMIIPKDHVFVLGDNRDISADSRIYGPVATDDVIAKASSILYGVNKRSGKNIE